MSQVRGRELSRLPHVGAYEYIAHMLYCYSIQDAGKGGLRWLAMTEDQRAPWFLKARKRVDEWRAVERGCNTRGETAVSFSRTFSGSEEA